MKKIEKIYIRVDETEKLAIAKNAKSMGLTISKFGREGMINGFVYQSAATGTNESNPMDRKLILNIANNLNQLTRYSHENKTLHPNIENLLKEINLLFEK